MRAAWLLVGLLLLPAASAQTVLPPPPITVLVQMPPDPITPLMPGAVLAARVEIPCDATIAAQGMDVLYSIEKLPAWATVRVSPASEHVGFGRCEGDRVVLTPSLTVAVSDSAPAFTPDTVTLAVEAQIPLHGVAKGKGSFPIAAMFFSILDTQASDDRKPVGPGEAVAFPVQIRNLGNANTKVSFAVELERGVRDLVVQPPQPLVLQSKQAGGAQTSMDLPILVHRLAGSTVNEPETIRLRYESSYALDGMLKGDSGVVTLVALPGHAPDALALAQAPEEVARQVPALAAPLVGLAVLGAALVLRRR